MSNKVEKIINGCTVGFAIAVLIFIGVPTLCGCNSKVVYRKTLDNGWQVIKYKTGEIQLVDGPGSITGFESSWRGVGKDIDAALEFDEDIEHPESAVEKP